MGKETINRSKVRLRVPVVFGPSVLRSGLSVSVRLLTCLLVVSSDLLLSVETFLEGSQKDGVFKVNRCLYRDRDPVLSPPLLDEYRY